MDIKDHVFKVQGVGKFKLQYKTLFSGKSCINVKIGDSQKCSTKAYNLDRRDNTVSQIGTNTTYSLYCCITETCTEYVYFKYFNSSGTLLYVGVIMPGEIQSLVYRGTSDVSVSIIKVYVNNTLRGTYTYNTISCVYITANGTSQTTDLDTQITNHAQNIDYICDNIYCLPLTTIKPNKSYVPKTIAISWNSTIYYFGQDFNEENSNYISNYYPSDDGGGEIEKEAKKTVKANPTIYSVGGLKYSDGTAIVCIIAVGSYQMTTLKISYNDSTQYVNYLPIRDGNGNITGYAIVITDKTSGNIVSSTGTSNFDSSGLIVLNKMLIYRGNGGTSITGDGQRSRALQFLGNSENQTYYWDPVGKKQYTYDTKTGTWS